MRAAAGGVHVSWGAGETAFWTFCFGRIEQAPAVTASGMARKRRRASRLSPRHALEKDRHDLRDEILERVLGQPEEVRRADEAR